MTDQANAIKPTWQEQFKIKAFQVDTQSRCRLSSILNFLQEAAGNHASHLGVGYNDLIINNKAWVLSRLFINVNYYPEWGESIEVETWPSAYDRIFAYRDFCFKDSKGVRFAYGKTAWVIMDIASRRMSPVSELVESFEHFPDKLGVEEMPAKVRPVKDERFPCSAEYTVRHSDLDTNEHVNNVKYIQWMLDDYGLEWHKNHQVSYLSINYLAEALPNLELCHSFNKVNMNPIDFVHSLKRRSDDKPICQAKISWKSQI
ncbi:MAG: acyl-ACP thioesterase domain-containing protein [Bacteroidota bacterium]